MKEKLVTRKQLAEAAGVTPKTIARWEKEGRVKVVGYISTHPRYDISALQNLLKPTSNGN